MHRWNAPRCARVSRAHRPTLWRLVWFTSPLRLPSHDISINATSKSMLLQCPWNSSDWLNPSMGQLSRTFALLPLRRSRSNRDPLYAIRFISRCSTQASFFTRPANLEKVGTKKLGYSLTRDSQPDHHSIVKNGFSKSIRLKVDPHHPGFSHTPSVHSRNRSRPGQSTQSRAVLRRARRGRAASSAETESSEPHGCGSLRVCQNPGGPARSNT